MKKFLFFVSFIILCMPIYASSDNDTVNVKDTVFLNEFWLDEITVTSFYSQPGVSSTELTAKKITSANVGQEPSHLFKHMPSTYAMSDNGTEFGYGYYRIRGLDQTRINVMLDGMPWNEAEDFGSYFANSPDLMSSMHKITVQRGTSSKTSGISAAAGTILLESVDLRTDTNSHFDLSYGSSKAHKASIVYNMGAIKNWGFHIKATQSGTDGYRDHSYNQSHAVTAKVGYFFNPYMSIDFLSMNGYHVNGQGWIGNYKWELDENPHANGNTRDEVDHWFQTIDKLNFKAAVAEHTLLNACTFIQYQTGAYSMDYDNYMRRIECMESDSGKIYNYGLTHYMYGGNVFVYDNTVDFMEFTGGVNAYWFQRRHFLDNDTAIARNMKESDYYDNTGYKTDISVSANFNFHATDKFDIGFNCQYRHVNFRYIDNITKDASDDFYIIHPTDGGFNTETVRTNWNFINGGIDLKYDFSNMHSVYAKLAVSNREPTRSTMFGGLEAATNQYTYIGELPTDTINVLLDKNIITTNKPELVHDVEIGYNVNHDIIKANINLFYMKFKDELILTGTYGLNGLPEHTNADSSYRFGIEVNFDLEPVKGLHFVNSTAWSRNRMKVIGLNKYTYHVMSPAWTLDQDIHYDYKFMTVGAVFNMRSSVYLDMENHYSIPAAMNLSAYFSCAFFHNRVNLMVKVSNITNRINYYNGAVNANGDILYFREAGVAALASLKYNF